MEFTKITSTDTVGKGVVGLPDTPALSTTEMQQKFDELATDVIIPKFNELSTELEEANIDKRILSDDVTNVRLNEDNNIEVSTDNGRTYKQTASSGHIIMDGTGRSFPQRSRMQYSANVVISDVEADNTTFLQVPSGVKGDKGDSATIQVGNVESAEIPYVENVGSQYDAIFNFGIPKGADGDSATIQVGTVSSGSNASVSNRGTSSNAIFDFVLPKGEKGDSGTSFQVLGTYLTYDDLIAAHPVGNRGDAYAVGDSDNNVVYNWNNDTREWDNLGALKGVKGDDGAAATITIGTVSEGTTPAVENVGTSTEAILNFTLAKGEKGDIGNAATIAVGNVEGGDVASVTNRGTTSNAVFDFVLPKGDKGNPGEPAIVNGKSGESIVLYGYDMFLKNYKKADQYSEITDDDSIQSAISKLESKGSGGSKIVVDTDEESIGNTFTISNGQKTYTQVASSTELLFYIDELGEFTITNVEAQNSTKINIETYSYFHVVLGVGNINVIVNYSEEYVGYDFTITGEGVTKTKRATDSMSVAFILAKTGTYTISNTLDDKTKVIDATEETTYETSFGGNAFDYHNWLSEAGITETYASLDDVLVDEKTVRILMDKHSSVDYLTLCEDTETIEKIMTSGYVEKWTNLCDYALDTLYAIPSFKSVMDETKLYGYGELELVDGEYQPKGAVPIMTSANAPYGEVIFANSQSGNDVFKVFNGDTNSYGGGASATMYMGYKFTNPIQVESVKYTAYNNGSSRSEFKAKIQSSNDNSVWKDLTEEITITNTDKLETEIPITKDKGYYLYYRIYFVTSTQTANNYSFTRELQFYGRQLKDLVPIMTSNTEPSGECIRDTVYNANSEAWKAFDKDSSNNSYYSTASPMKNTDYIGYDFKKEICVNQVKIVVPSNAYHIKTFKVQGFSSSWEDITEILTFADNTVYDLNNNKKYTKYRILCVTNNSNQNCQFSEITFYGLDYSERTSRHYIYDNGVDVENVTKTSTSVLATLDTTSYKLLRATVGKYATTTDKIKCGSGNVTLNGMPNNNYLDISSINGNNETGFSVVANANDIACWLE